MTDLESVSQPLWRRDDERFAELRSRYLAQTTGLDRKVAGAVAWSEIGYSESGIAKRIDRAEGTVGAYLDEVVEEYAPQAAHVRHPEDIAVDAELPGTNGGGET